MRCPTLRELPPRPEGAIGWPWTAASPSAPREGPPESSWPRISIVTPSYNQAPFLEGTIRSILLQGYPDLEYLIIDDGSTDHSVEIIQRYAPWLTYWTRQSNCGLSATINRGLDRCTGEAFNWIASDDQLAPGALVTLGRLWSSERPHLLVGRGKIIEVETGRVLHDWFPKPPRGPRDFFRAGRVILPQASTFLALDLVKDLGRIREDLEYIMDWELYFRAAVRLRGALRVTITPALLSTALRHPAAKTSQGFAAFHREAQRVLLEALPGLPFVERRHATACWQRLKTYELVRGVMADPQTALRRLARLSWRWPFVLRSRFFWGAVRQAVTGRVEPTSP